MEDQIKELWGKTTTTDHFHPAIYHMIDVGHVTRLLLASGTTPRIRSTLEHTWQGCHFAALYEWLPFLVALHDIGKLSAPFQGQQTTHLTRTHAQRLAQHGFFLPPLPSTPRLPHTLVGAVFIADHLGELEPGVSRRFIHILRDAINGHHGQFSKELGIVRDALTAIGEPVHWNPIRKQGYSILHRYFAAPNYTLAEIGQPQSIRAATIGLVGLMTLADWIGSNASFFPANCTASLQEYYATSESYLFELPPQIGFIPRRTLDHEVNCASLFPDCAETLRPIQQIVDNLTLDATMLPSLFLIEAPTGEGKTEAAQTLAQRIAKATGSDEIFVALPTIATSNHMFVRMSQLYQRLYGDQGMVKLVHGQARLVEDDLRQLVLDADRYIDSDAQQTSDVLPSSEHMLTWFSSSKRALLAPFGVGTVDQVELAGLNTRHYMLRLFSLAGKVVMLDEVHAYDTYMNTILEHTLQWLAVLGSSVILLSATLPAQRRNALIAAFQAGLTKNADQPATTSSAAYPLLTHVAATSIQTLEFAAFRPHQQIKLAWLHTSTLQAKVQYLFDCISDGGAVAWICNRVADAQALYAALMQHPDCHTLTAHGLLHARMPQIQRQAREQQVQQLLGNHPRNPTDRIIIIGTQVLEQSLDYDVDVMISDLAPIDLLLQRAGRLQRHQRQRRPAHQQACLTIYHPWDQQGLPAIYAWQRIYAAYILYQTWHCLQALEQPQFIQLPQDYRRLIEAVYSASPPTPNPPAPYLQTAWNDLQRNQTMMNDTARVRLIPPPHGRDPISVANLTLFTADEDHAQAVQGWLAAQTRLGDRITVVPLFCLPNQNYALDSAGVQRIQHTADEGLTLAAQRDLLNHAIPLSHPAWLLTRLRNQRWPWKKLPVSIKYLIPLFLHPNGQALIDPSVRLDPDLGLVIDYQGGERE
ncbi:CRISPR-associated helicase Cas3' [Herpetosiphon gulosus]|uniref:CRISPR-associated endonuclease/helicase Cas3 n=1 Tax=Herpetosiphon gulosus TaxID=1973496 RepID=A0ABP9X712_9CHLR